MQTITVNTSRSYDVKIGSGLLDLLGRELAAIAGGQVFVVTDSNVAPLCLGRVYRSLTAAGFRVATASVPACESSKDLAHYQQLLQLFAEKQLSRADTVLALGGGVVGDLAGFAAATYLRGVRLVQVPTTLLAMVDASVGGKTAIDLPSGKNLVGAFHQPSLVLCDPEVLDSLPPETFRDGCAEIIKTAILFDPTLFAHLQQHGTNFDREHVISRCVTHKREVVCADEFDTGRRQLLNLGHTIGHAIEQLGGYCISHGSAVATGIAMMARYACRDRAAVEALLEQFGLPTHTTFSARVLAAAALSDKKRSGGTMTLVVPHAIGNCTLEKIPVERLQAIIEAGL